MRVAFAILFSLLLGLSQTALPVCPTISAKRVCSSCACPKGNDCCYAKSTRSSQSAPIAPVRQLSNEQLQLAMLQGALVAIQSTPAALKVHQSDFFSPASTAVPLYYRNCSLLI